MLALVRSARRHPGTAVLLALFMLAAGAAPANATTIEQRVAAAVAGSGVSGISSVVVWEIDSRAVVYRHREHARVTPASNEKLYTAAAALSALGPAYRFQTRIALRGVQEGDVFTGTVYLVGGGDPTLSTRAFANRNLSGRAAILEDLIAPLDERGIRRIKGNLVADESFLDRHRYVDAWPLSFRYDESTALGALAVNQSYLGAHLYEGPSSRQPALRTAAVYRQLLAAKGITFGGITRVGRMPATAVVIGAVSSPPLRQVVQFMNRQSDNFTAEVLIKDLGAIERGTGSTAAGLRAARAEFKELNVPLDDVRMVDGSGLATSNRTSARSIANLLYALDRNAMLSESFLASLAVSGRDGTLRDRLDRRPYRGRIRAKTGTLNQSSALSGFATRLNGRRYGFSVVTYRPTSVNWTTARSLQDAIAAILVR